MPNQIIDCGCADGDGDRMSCDLVGRVESNRLRLHESGDRVTISQDKDTATKNQIDCSCGDETQVVCQDKIEKMRQQPNELIVAPRLRLLRVTLSKRCNNEWN
jgi:hypothetical protein